MTEEITGVKEEASQAPTSSPEVETEQSLPQEAPQEGVTSKDDIATNLQRALKEEREKRRKAEARAKELEEREPVQYSAPIYEPEAPVDDRLGRLNYKLATDPTFKERLKDVEEVLATNPNLTVEQADDMVLASAFRNLMANSEEKKEELKSLNQTAIPEPQAKEPLSLGKIAQRKQSSGNPHLDEALRRVGW